jgi:hypothetical protein
MNSKPEEVVKEYRKTGHSWFRDLVPVFQELMLSF